MILDGKEIRNKIFDELKIEVNKLEIKPYFEVIQVGNNEASNIYIRQKEKMANYIGYGFKLEKLDESNTTNDMVNLINRLNNDKMVHGIIVQMPLPSHMDEKIIQNAVLPCKDIDGLCNINSGLLFQGKESLRPCTPSGVMELLARYGINVMGMNAVVVGKSNLVGKPMAMMLLNEGATVTVCHSKTKELAKYTKEADIVVVAVGKPKLITSDMVKDGAIVIDVGITRLDTGLCGDVDYENVSCKTSYITKVPGGVGPMTVAMLANNVYKAYMMQKDVEK